MPYSSGTAADEPPKRGSIISRNRRDETRNPAARVLVPGSGMTKPSKRTFKVPAHLTQHHAQHRAAARRSAPPHDGPSATGRAPRHGAGIRPPEGRHVPSAHIRARLAPVLYRSSFVVVVVVSGQWCTHCNTRDNRRLVAIKTAFARWRNSWRTPKIITHAGEITKLDPISKFGWRSGMLRTWHSRPVQAQGRLSTGLSKRYFRHSGDRTGRPSPQTTSVAARIWCALVPRALQNFAACSSTNG